MIRLEIVIGMQNEIFDGHHMSLFQIAHLKTDLNFGHRGFQVKQNLKSRS